MPYLEQSVAKLKVFEGSIAWMYLDTVGKVTVGVGLMLPTVAAAIALPFEVQGVLCTVEEIGDEYDRIKDLPAGHMPGFYLTHTSPMLPSPAIDACLLKTLTAFDGALRAAVPGYDQLPDGVKLALLDIIYNTGANGLLHGFPHMMAAVEAGNYKLAAAQSHRPQVAAARNLWVFQQLSEA